MPRTALSKKSRDEHQPPVVLDDFIPTEIGKLANPQTDLPRIARDQRLTAAIEARLREIPTSHNLHLADARRMQFLQPESVHLVVTSPPYWTLKEYRDSEGQLGHVADYETFLRELDEVWKHCYRALVPGGRLIVVVGDVCLSRRKNDGRHMVVPLHASIQEHCRTIGFDNLATIIWHKIANAVYEVENGSGFLGKPYEPNAVIKNDTEFILMQRKHGGYRSPSLATRVLSVISADNYQKWFQQIWSGLTGASTKHHPAPYPLELAERLVRMFGFVGDTVLDPFAGTGTTTLAASRWGRNSIGVEVDTDGKRSGDLVCRRLAWCAPRRGGHPGTTRDGRFSCGHRWRRLGERKASLGSGTAGQPTQCAPHDRFVDPECAGNGPIARPLRLQTRNRLVSRRDRDERSRGLGGRPGPRTKAARPAAS